MDAFLAVASKREVRRYEPRPLDENSRRRILDAGRVAGSASNRQNRRIGLAWHSERQPSPAARAFMELARSVCGPPGAASAA